MLMAIDIVQGSIMTIIKSREAQAPDDSVGRASSQEYMWSEINIKYAKIDVDLSCSFLSLFKIS